MKRGDLVAVAISGDFGKPRPALIIQSDLFSEIPSVTVLPLTSTKIDAPLIRLDIEPTRANGLRKASQVMIDKPMTIKRDKIGNTFGSLNDAEMMTINRLLALFLGFA
ncbi:type II toxin-antitoxin system PemK/MazF family toxin [Halomonas sp. CH40]